jgi:hypothetical protein
MSAVLDRQHFQISRDAEYFSRGELEKQTGQPATGFFHVLLKELVDNALDAAETAGNTPSVAVNVAFSDDLIQLSVSDNGDGIPPEVVEKILDFRTRTSDKAAYRAPTRGAQGNALKTVLGIPHALGADTSSIMIEAQGLRHTISAWLDQAGQVRIERDTETVATAGTRIETTVPGHQWLNCAPRRWGVAYALFNPHAEVRIEQLVEGSYRANDPEPVTVDFYPPTDPEWKRFLPTAPTSPHWYTEEEFARLVLLSAHKTDMPVRAFVRQFKGLSGSAKAKAVCTAINADRLSDLDGDSATIARLHAVMCRESTEIKPQALGVIGEDHMLQRLGPTGRHWYKRILGAAGSIPFVVEALLAEDDGAAVLTGVNFSPTFDDPLAATRLQSPEFQTQGVRGFLYRCEATVEDGFSLALHIACPSLRFLDRGKTRLETPPELADACSKALWSVCKTAFAEMKARERDQRRAEKRAEERRREDQDVEALKYKVFRVLPPAVEHATNGGQYPTSPRRLFYKIRPLLAAETDRDLAYSYFSQALLTEYQEEHGAIGNLYYDPRGWLYEPHSGTKIPLGTKEVREYQFPAWRYDKILFVEKKGLWPILERARIAERYDLAIVTSEGFATVAARELFARAQQGRDYKLFVVHDCDLDGYNIARTLQEATKRLPNHNIDVIDLGLRLEQAEALGLEAETYTRRKAPPETIELTDAQRAFFIERQKGKQFVARRYELDALDPAQLVAMIEDGLREHGADEKLIPPCHVTFEQAQTRFRYHLAARIKEEIDQALNVETIVATAAQQLPKLLRLDRAQRWVEHRIGIPPDDPDRPRTQSWDRALDDAIDRGLDRVAGRIRRAALDALRRGMEARP